MSENMQKPKQISSLTGEELTNRFDIFLFDAYGVFWDGSKLITTTVDDMEGLVKENKEVSVISNTTQLSVDAKKSYEKRGLIEGIHYNKFLTSGDMFRESIMNGEIQKNIEKSLNISFKEEDKIKVYIFGNPRKELFKESNFEIVDSKEEANCIYLSIPQFTLEEKNSIIEKHPEYEEYFKKSSLTKEGEPERWDVIAEHPEVFNDTLEEFVALKLPILNANPDCSAHEKEKGTDPVKINSVVRNGSLTKILKENSAVVFEYGKPNKEIFEEALKKLEIYENFLERSKKNICLKKELFLHFSKKNKCSDTDEYESITIKVLKSRTVMVGDTKETDIEGAKNAGINTVLVTMGNGEKYKENGGRGSTATYILLNRN